MHGSLLENNAILMFDWNILHFAISFSVACAVVLDFDDDTSQLAIRNVENVFDDRSVPAHASDIPNQDGQPTADFQCGKTPFQTDHQEFSKLFIAPAIAQVT